MNFPPPVLPLLAVCLLQATSHGGDWTHFLGPRYDLHCDETGLNLDFPESGPPLLWEVERGRGHGGPVIAGDRVVSIDQVEDQERIRCHQATDGKLLWEHSYAVETNQNFGIVDAPRSSPLLDAAGGLVFTLGNDGDLTCLKLEDGSVVWSLSLEETFGPSPFFFGYGSCPLLYGDKLIVNVGAEEVCVAALNKSDGKPLWKTDHTWHGSYASPIVTELNGVPRLLVFAGGKVDPPTGGLICLDPETGIVDSEFPWRSDTFTSVVAASPVACGENRVFLTEDYGKGGVMLQYDETFQPRVIWQAPELGCRFQTPIYHEGMLYGVGGSGGLLIAYDAASGRPFWNEAFYQTTIPWQGRPIPISLGRAHLIHVEDSFLCLGEDGVLMRLRMNASGFQIQAKSRLFYAPESWAPPVISDGRLYVMQNEFGPRLLCYDLSGTGEGKTPSLPGN